MNDYERIGKVIRYLDAHYLEQPDLSRLADVARVSEFHFHRLFSRWAGITPKGFLKFLTAAHAKERLRQSRSVSDASLESGLSGPGRLHDLMVSVDGVTPGEFKAKGADLLIRYGFQDSPFGLCSIGLTNRGVCHLSFLEPAEKKKAFKEFCAPWPDAKLVNDPRSIAKTISNIFRPASSGTSIRAYLMGTPFQLKVWEALVRIPQGKVFSYGDVARAVGSPGSSRAVGTAVASNKVAYLIPCHRVVRETGAFGEYRWGSLRKRAILAWEGRDIR